MKYTKRTLEMSELLLPRRKEQTMKWTVEPSAFPDLYNVYDEEGNRVTHHATREQADLIASAPDLLAEQDALRTALRMALPMLEEYRKWLIDDAIARGDVLEGEAWNEMDAQIEQARAVLDAVADSERNE